jgi:hypothetical protein
MKWSCLKSFSDRQGENSLGNILRLQVLRTGIASTAAVTIRWVLRRAIVATHVRRVLIH